VNRALGLSRRGFIGAALAAGGSVLFYMRAGAQPPGAAAAVLLNGWIRIAPDGAVTVFSRTTELGQGALTSLAMIVAEELALAPDSVTVEMAPVTEPFMDHGNTLGYGIGAAYYATWGSLSSRDMDRSMRKIAATVRVLLLRAAAQRWTVAETECSADNGVVRHSGGRKTSNPERAPTGAAWAEQPPASTFPQKSTAAPSMASMSNVPACSSRPLRNARCSAAGWYPSTPAPRRRCPASRRCWRWKTRSQ